MPEDIIAGLVESEEGPEREESQAKPASGADPVAILLAMNAMGIYPEVAKEAAKYLEEQRKAAERQRELLNHTLKHLDEDRRQDAKGAKLKRISDIFRLGWQVALALIAVAAAGELAYLFVSAVWSRSVVVEEFKAPSALAPMGLTGEVVATGVLDQLEEMRQATRSAEKALAATSAWSSDVKIEVPEMGVSIGEINRLLRKQFGHDVHISGDLVQTTEGGLILTVRGDGVPSKSFPGSATELGKLTVQAAEYVFGRSQPYQMLSYYGIKDRQDECVKFAQNALTWAKGNRLQAELLNGWGVCLQGQNLVKEASEKFRLAVSVDSHFWTPRANLATTLFATDGDELAYQASKDFMRAVATAKPSDRPRLTYMSQAAQLTYDLPLLLQAEQDNLQLNSGAGFSPQTAASLLAYAYAQMHDQPAAQSWILQSDPKAPETEYYRFLDDILLSIYSGQSVNAGDLLSKAHSAWDVWLASPSIQEGDDTPCLIAYVFGLNGDIADANEALKRMGSYTRCAALQGALMDQQGNLAGAEAVWAQSIAKAPNVPLVYLARGRSRMEHGDLRGAEADFGEANRCAPHFADPLKFWGDLLAKEDKNSDALLKYEEAGHYAGNWAELRQASKNVKR
jgi:tetratricopeptide (TPR) repeat protein